jgi:hypothetical protein
MHSPPKRNVNVPREVGEVLANYMRTANVRHVAPRTVARFVASAGSRNIRSRVGRPKALNNIKNRKERAKKIANRWRFLTNQLHRNMLEGTNTLTKNNKEFLEYFNFAKMRGEAYSKQLGSGIRRQPRGRFSTNPLSGYNLYRHMKTVRRTGTNPEGRPVYAVTPMFVYATNVNKKGRSLYEKMPKTRFKMAVKKVLAKKNKI